MSKYLIWSNEHRMWWRDSWTGYTTEVTEAGRYSHEEALDICYTAIRGWKPGENIPELPVLEQDVLSIINSRS
jgi:hypothetical protein